MKTIVYAITMAVIALITSTVHSESIGPTVKVVIPYAPGGGVDSVFRLVQSYAVTQNINLIPEYKPGAQGQIGIAYADNNNLMLFTVMSDIKKYNQATSHSNLVPISGVATNVFMVVTNNKSNITSLNQVTNLMKTSPEKLNWGVGSSVLADLTNDIVGELTNTTLPAFLIPFNGSGPVLASLLSNSVDVAVLPGSVATPAIEAGLLRKLAIWNTDAKCEGCVTLPTVLNNTKKTPDGYGLYASNNSIDNTRWRLFIERFLQDKQTPVLLRSKQLVAIPPSTIFVTN